MDMWNSNSMKVNLRNFAKELLLLNSLNTELCWLCSFFLYWLFPYGSQSSQIIEENFILEFPKNMMEAPSLR